MSSKLFWLSLFLSAFLASSSTRAGKDVWSLCGSSRHLQITSVVLELEGTIEDGYVVIKSLGEVKEVIANGTFTFRIENLNEGTEIAYKGPYSLCCAFFEGSNCSWVGEYPHQQQIGGCPVPVGPFSSMLRRPLWIKSAGVYKAEVKLFSELGEEISCYEVMAELNRTGGRRGGEGGEGGEILQHNSLVPMKSNTTSSTDEVEVSAKERAHRRKIVHQGDEEVQVNDAEFHSLLAAGRNWSGLYRSASSCGPGCCCLNDERVEFTFVEKVKGNKIWGTLSAAGRSQEGSPGACKGAERLNIRHFVIQKDNYNRAEKKFCQSSCQTLIAERKFEDNNVVVTIRNDQHVMCGEQKYICVHGPCADKVDISAGK